MSYLEDLIATFIATSLTFTAIQVLVPQVAHGVPVSCPTTPCQVLVPPVVAPAPSAPKTTPTAPSAPKTTPTAPVVDQVPEAHLEDLAITEAERNH